MTQARRRLAVVRHGVTDHNAGAIWQGHLDTALNATGQAQARAAARALAALHPVFVRSSDLTRARHTGEVIAAACGVPLETDPGLREIHVGQWQGRTHAHVIEAYPALWQAICAGEDLARGEDGETVAQVVQRARPVADAAIARIPAGGVGVLVTHGVTARALVADLAGIDQAAAWNGFVGLRNAHWALLEEAGAPGPATSAGHHDPLGTWRIALWNASADTALGADLGSGAGSG